MPAYAAPTDRPFFYIRIYPGGTDATMRDIEGNTLRFKTIDRDAARSLAETICDAVNNHTTQSAEVEER